MSDCVLVTGASGFVGTVLCEVLARSGYRVRAALRTDRPVSAAITEKVVVGEIGSTTEWSEALDGVRFVIHAAARAHIMADVASNADEYVETNARGTRQLASAAARAGVRRLIYLSSIKVNGEETGGRSYTADDEARPQDAYGVSKWMAEQYLREVCAGTALEFAMVRSPLVYGAGVRANFFRLMTWVDKERPLPFGAIRNRRSLVNVWNLCDLLTNLITHPAAAGHTWMVSDGEDVSTPDLIRRIATAMGRQAKLLPIPIGFLEWLGRLAGKDAEVRRLCGSLTVDMSRTIRDLGWSPGVSVDVALARTVNWYLAGGKTHGA